MTFQRILFIALAILVVAMLPYKLLFALAVLATILFVIDKLNNKNQ